MDLVIECSEGRDGITYSIEPESLRLLKETMGSVVRPRPRVFVAHGDSVAKYDTAYVEALVRLLVGIPLADLKGNVLFNL